MTSDESRVRAETVNLAGFEDELQRRRAARTGVVASRLGAEAYGLGRPFRMPGERRRWRRWAGRNRLVGGDQSALVSAYEQAAVADNDQGISQDGLCRGGRQRKDAIVHIPALDSFGDLPGQGVHACLRIDV